MITIRALLVIAVAILAFVVDERRTAFGQPSGSVPQASTYKIAADRDEDNARGARNSPTVVKPDDDDEKPRTRPRPDDQSTRDRIQRGDYYPERDLDRLKGRNFRD